MKRPLLFLFSFTTALLLMAEALSAGELLPSSVSPPSSVVPRPLSVVNYSWASGKIDGAIWGMAQGDLNGDGAKELVLLDRRRVRVGTLDAEGFKQSAACDLPGRAEGARVDAIDFDGDGADEIIVSAVEEGMPAAAALGVTGGACRTLFERARWSLRVVEGSPQGRKRLIGQSWSSDSYFFGPVFEMRFEKGKLTNGAPLDLPRGTPIYQFASVPAEEGVVRVALLKGFAPLEVRELVGKKFKKVWRSPGRLGGSANQLTASQREVLGEEQSQGVIFDLPPLAGLAGGTASIFAVKSDIPARGIIGRKLGISGARIEGFTADPALGFTPAFETVELPSCVTAAIFGRPAAGAPQGILALLQNECGMFKRGMESQIVAFPVPGLDS